MVYVCIGIYIYICAEVVLCFCDLGSAESWAEVRGPRILQKHKENAGFQLWNRGSWIWELGIQDPSARIQDLGPENQDLEAKSWI